jgi:hypothetical protein
VAPEAPFVPLVLLKKSMRLVKHSFICTLELNVKPDIALGVNSLKSLEEFFQTLNPLGVALLNLVECGAAIGIGHEGNVDFFGHHLW